MNDINVEQKEIEQSETPLEQLDCHNCGSEKVTKHTASICDISDSTVLVCDECGQVHIARCEECDEYLSKKSLEDCICENCKGFVCL